MSDLSDHEIETLLADAQAADRGERRIQGYQLHTRIGRLLNELRRLREEAGERERMHAQEVSW